MPGTHRIDSVPDRTPSQMTRLRAPARRDQATSHQCSNPPHRIVEHGAHSRDECRYSAQLRAVAEQRGREAKPWRRAAMAGARSSGRNHPLQAQQEGSTHHLQLPSACRGQGHRSSADRDVGGLRRRRKKQPARARQRFRAPRAEIDSQSSGSGEPEQYGPGALGRATGHGHARSRWGQLRIVRDRLERGERTRVPSQDVEARPACPLRRTRRAGLACVGRRRVGPAAAIVAFARRALGARPTTGSPHARASRLAADEPSFELGTTRQRGHPGGQDLRARHAPWETTRSCRPSSAARR